jgi:pimeloyl-ACP methyl ester carboxylesterase
MVVQVVLIHGLSIPAMIWKNVAPQLASRGFRVLVYGMFLSKYVVFVIWFTFFVLSDLYGRGYSDAPQTTYDANLYTTQLALLMQHLRWDKALVAGVSMGGGIATAFTAQFPHLVDEKVVLLACAGLMEVRCYLCTQFTFSPLIGERYVAHCKIYVFPDSPTYGVNNTCSEIPPALDELKLECECGTNI